MRFLSLATSAAVLLHPQDVPADEAPTPTLELVTDPVQFASWIPNQVRGASKIEISEDGKHLTLEVPAGERLDLLLRCPPQQPDFQALQGQWAPASVGNADSKNGVLAYQRSLPMPGFDRGLWEFGLNVPPWPGTELSGRFACVAVRGNQEPIELALRLMIIEGGSTPCARQEFAVVQRAVSEYIPPVMVAASGGITFSGPGSGESGLGMLATVEGWWFPGGQTFFSVGGAYLASQHLNDDERLVETKAGIIRREIVSREFTQTNIVLAQAGYHGLFSAETPWLGGGIDLGMGMKYSFSTYTDMQEHITQETIGLGSAILIAPGFQMRAGEHWRFPVRISYLVLGEQPDQVAFTAGVAYLP